MYDPSAPGPFRFDVATIEVHDVIGRRVFPVETWTPVGAERPPLVIYSHYSRVHRRAATFLAARLARGDAPAFLDSTDPYVG